MTRYPRTSSNESTISGQADPRREIDEVIRDAEAVIHGQPQGAPGDSTDESVGSEAIERVSGLTQGLEDLAAEVADIEASMDRDPGEMDLTAGAAKTPSKSEVVATPTVSLVGDSSTSDQAASADTAEHEDASATTGSRLSDLLSEKVQRGFGEIEQMVADARESSFGGDDASDDGDSTGTPVDQARVAEQEAMAEIDAAIGHESDASDPPPSQVLRDTATTVDATLDGLAPIDDVPEPEPAAVQAIDDVPEPEPAAMEAIDDVEPTGPASIDVVAEPPPTSSEETEATIESTPTVEEAPIESSIDAASDSDATDTAEVETVSAEPTDVDSEPVTETSPEADPEPTSESEVEATETDGDVDRGVDAIEPEPPAVVEPQGSLGLRILTKPMRLLPASAQSLTTALAASLVVWVPIAWAWAVFAPDPSTPTESSDALPAAIVLDGASGPEAPAGVDPTNASIEN